MEFASADPSVVRSIRQRYLLNEWLRAAGKRQPMPLLRDFQLDRVDDEMADMMGYDVVGEGDGARFLITHQGARLATTYGNERVDPAERTALPRRGRRARALCQCCRSLSRLSSAPAANLFDFDGAGCRQQGGVLRTAADAVRQRRSCPADRRLLQEHQHRRRLQDQQPDGPEAESRAGDPGQGDYRSRFRAGSSKPAIHPTKLSTSIRFCARAISTALPCRRCPA